MMTTLGEKMTREEVKEMMIVADGNNNGNINHKGT
jgi:Ca2+-binding EF-hand superfamily protein